MSTEQSNVGKGDSANSFEQTAENATQAALNEADQHSGVNQTPNEIPQDEPNAYFLRVANNCEASGHLEKLLKSVEELWWNNDAVPAILEMCNTWLANAEGSKQDRTLKVQSVLDLVRTTVVLTRQYGHFDNTIEEDARND